MSDHQSRNPGLDLVRFLAISLVLVSHSRHLFGWLNIPRWDWWWLSVGGFLGVELFFVLSGFLIGRILLRDVLLSGSPAWKSLRSFWIRRWFRTLPLYYLVLLFTYAISVVEGQPESASWLHLVFLQNLDRDAIRFFSVSWSLSVEEWFYLLTPLVILSVLPLLSGSGDRATSVVQIIIAMIIVVALARATTVYAHPELTWGDIRKSIFIRFDSILLGVWWAWLSVFRKQTFAALSCPLALTVALLGLLALVGWYYDLGPQGLDQSFLAKSLMFGLASCLLLPAVGYCVAHIRKSWQIVTYGSLLSYGIYLIHLQLLSYFLPISAAHGNVLVSLGLWFAFLGMTVLIAYILYRFYEHPAMQLRERWS